MRIYIIAIITIFLFVCSLFIGAIGVQNKNTADLKENFSNFTTIIEVDNEGDGDFTSIQEAILNSIPGDIIRVYSGIYNESINLNINNIIIEGVDHELEEGGDENFPIIDGGFNGNVVIINADNVSIKNLVIKNSGYDYFDSGIEIFSNYNTISGCAIFNCFYGININMFSYNDIKDNIITQNVMDGIIIFSSEGNIISNNEISNNGYQGIYMYIVSDNIISENKISFNGKDGVHLFDSCNSNQISNNEILLNNIDGIKFYLHNNHDNNISENLINYNNWNGIHFMDGYENLVINNILDANQWDGIHFGNSDGNHIIANTINHSSNEGIFIFEGSTDNKIYYNNIIFNGAIDKGSNIWNNDYPFGGNFWTYYTGYDNNEDGIGDIPFNIPGGNSVDKFPIINPISPPNIPEKPSGNIFGIPDKIYSYSSITSDLNNDSIKYGWDWNGDRTLDEWTNFYKFGEKCYLNHSWDEKGTYIIYVKAMDIRGMETDWSDMD